MQPPYIFHKHTLTIGEIKEKKASSNISFIRSPDKNLKSELFRESHISLSTVLFRKQIKRFSKRNYFKYTYLMLIIVYIHFLTAGGSVVSTRNTKDYKSSSWLQTWQRSAQHIIQVCKLYTTIVGTSMRHTPLSNGTPQFHSYVSLLYLGRCLNISQTQVLISQSCFLYLLNAY
jgi:hypothetical protein